MFIAYLVFINTLNKKYCAFYIDLVYNIHMISTKTLLLTIFVPLACLKFFGFYQKIVKVSEPSLKQIKAKLERAFAIDS